MTIKKKKADLVYQKQLKEKVRQEREQRLKQSQQPLKVPLKESSSSLEPTNVTESSPRNAATLRVRLLNGESIVENFEATTMLGNVMRTLNEKYQVKGSYNFRMLFPNKVFTTADEEQTLQQLNLVPNATLVMTQSEVAGVQHQASTQSQQALGVPAPSYFRLTWSYLASWVYWFIGTGTPTPAPQTPPSSFGSIRGKVNHVHSAAEYNQLKNTNDLVIVDISATWCGPCKKIAPYFEELARNHHSVVFVHVDLDQFKRTLTDLSGISSVPTFLFFKNKKLVTEVKGANSQNLLQALNRYK